MTTLARYFIKTTARTSFTRLRVTRRINGIHSVVSPSYLILLDYDKFKFKFKTKVKEKSEGKTKEVVPKVISKQ